MLLTWAASQGANAPGFSVALQSSLTPSQALGSPTPTFTRASAAAHTDFEGVVRQVPSGAARFQGARYVRNLVTRSDAITAAAGWTLTNVTSVVGAADPQGGTSAYTVTATADGGAPFRQNAGAAVVGHSYLVEIWARRVSGVGAVSLANINNGGNTALSLSSTWKRFSLPAATASGTSAWLVVTLATNGDVVELYGPQIEDVTGQTNQNPSEYVPSLATANADSGAIGVSYPWIGYPANVANKVACLNGNTVVGNVVVEAQGPAISSSRAECAGGVTAGVVDASGPLGYLSEGARTQYLGVTSAPATQTTGSLSTGTYTLSVVGSGTATPSGGTATITGAAAASAAAPNTFTVTVAGTVTVTVSGSLTFFQLENGAFKSSQIQNAGAAGTSVQRAADVLTYPAAGNVSGTQGSAFGEYLQPLGTVVAGTQFIIGSSGAVAPLYVSGATTVGAADGANFPNGPANITLGSLSKVASTWGGSALQVFSKGAAGTASAFGGNIQSGASFAIGNIPAGGKELFGTIRNVRLFPQPLSAARMVALTSP